MSATPATALPRWDTAQYFPGVSSPEFNRSLSDLATALLSAEASFDDMRVGESDASPTDERSAEFATRTLILLNGLMGRARLLRGYASCTVSADSKDLAAAAKQSELAGPLSSLTRLHARFAAWIATRNIGTLLEHSSVCREHAYFLQRLKDNASKLLPKGEEELLADLYDSTCGAWGRLYGRFTSRLPVPYEGRTMTMSQVRALAYDADPEVRRTAFEAETKAWSAHSLPVAASINSVKAMTSVVAKRRGWESLLDEAVEGASIRRSTLDAMTAAVDESLPSLRRYFKAKARALGHSGGLPWPDLFAPWGEGEAWSYQRAVSFVCEKFSGFSPRLEDLARRADAESWVDAEPRDGKVDGAFCSGIRGGESLILMNFKASFGSVATLAHELGHAYHNVCLDGKTEIQRILPMTLAETASIFCETIVKRAALAEAAVEDRASVLEASLQGQLQIVVDIASRFRFEKEVVEKRAGAELSADDLCDAMARAQAETYGDGLAEGGGHPFMWAAKPHYYSGRAFYNFPYTFGLLFALGLYQKYEREPAGFAERFEGLLASSGSASAEDLAAGFGIDISDVGFWRGSLAQIVRDVDEFEAAVA